MNTPISLIHRLSASGKAIPYDSFALTNDKISLTYSELIVQVASFASWLKQHGVTAVALNTQNNIEWVLFDLACQEAGIRCLPLPDFFSLSQLEHCIANTDIDLLLSDSENLFGQLKKSEQAWQEIKSPSSLKALVLNNKLNFDNRKFPVNTQKITFTSGSTGTPKGVCLSVDHQWQTATSIANTIDISAPKHLCLLPLSTLLENVAGVYAPLLCGGTVVVPNNVERGLSGSSGLNISVFLHCISRTQPTTLVLVPQLLTALVAACQQGWVAPKSLQFIAVGGAKVATDLLKSAHSCGLPVYEGYGLSECGSVVALNSLKDFKHGKVGRPLSHCNITTLGDQVIVSGSVFLGYLDDPESWYPKEVHTGDLGELENGYLTINGRKKNLIISSLGRNISPEWIESELCSTPLLTQCVVVGDDRPYLSALLSAPDSISNTMIKQWILKVNTDLPDYAQVKAWSRLNPTDWHELLTANGRPQRQKINHIFKHKIEALYQQNK